MGRVLRGRFSAHPKGFGFVEIEDSEAPDVFVAPRDVGGALHGDQVEVELRAPRRGGRDRGPRGRVRRVLKRADRLLVGHLIHPGGQPYLASDRRRHPTAIRIQGAEGLDHGTMVAARVTGEEFPVAQLTHVLGDPEDPEMPYRVACARHGIATTFSREAEQAAATCHFPDRQAPAGRRDLRKELCVTIDGPDARDFDDAVSINRLEDGGWRLGVHIADVSHYVRPDGPLDEEARSRGTSVYFADRAVPMLPERLSNDLCSLRPQHDRLTLTVQIDYDAHAGRRSVRCFESVIRSQARLTYDRVADLALDGEKSASPSESTHEAGPGSSDEELLKPVLEQMLRLAGLLRERRIDRGAIDLDLPEPEAVFDSNGAIVRFEPRRRNRAHQLIEEFMLEANDAVARFVRERGRSLIYRVHDPPQPDRLESFERVAAHFGYRLGSAHGEPEHEDFQHLLAQLKERPERCFLAPLLLRSFERARYSEKNSGHFGLADDCYTHFTSPIRRYPDLVIHRLLKAALMDEPEPATSGGLAAIAEQSSRRERAAQDAEREVLKILMARTMLERVGEVVDAIVIGVSRWGLDLLVPAELVEGRVPVESFLEEMSFYPDALRLAGKRNAFQIGDQIRAAVVRVETDSGEIELEVAD